MTITQNGQPNKLQTWPSNTDEKSPNQILTKKPAIYRGKKNNFFAKFKLSVRIPKNDETGTIKELNLNLGLIFKQNNEFKQNKKLFYKNKNTILTKPA